MQRYCVSVKYLFDRFSDNSVWMVSIKGNGKWVGRQRETNAATLPHLDNITDSEKICLDRNYSGSVTPEVVFSL